METANTTKRGTKWTKSGNAWTRILLAGSCKIERLTVATAPGSWEASGFGEKMSAGFSIGLLHEFDDEPSTFFYNSNDLAHAKAAALRAADKLRMR